MTWERFQRKNSNRTSNVAPRLTLTKETLRLNTKAIEALGLTTGDLVIVNYDTETQQVQVVKTAVEEAVGAIRIGKLHKYQLILGLTGLLEKLTGQTESRVFTLDPTAAIWTIQNN